MVLTNEDQAEVRNAETEVRQAKEDEEVDGMPVRLVDHGWLGTTGATKATLLSNDVDKGLKCRMLGAP